MKSFLVTLSFGRAQVRYHVLAACWFSAWLGATEAYGRPVVRSVRPLKRSEAVCAA